MPCTMRMRWGEAGVEATEHEVWRSTPSRSAAAAGGGRRRAVWAKSRRRGEKGEGGSYYAPRRTLGGQAAAWSFSEGGGGWRRDMKSSDVSSCPQMRAFAKGDRPRFPRPRGDPGGGAQSTVRHQGWRGRRVIVFLPPPTPSLCGLGCGAADSRGRDQR